MWRTSLRWVALSSVAGLFGLVGCGSKSVGQEGELCKNDGDCAANETCELVAETRRRPAVIAPCMATYTPCTEDANCGEGVCVDYERANLPFYNNCPPPPPKVCAAKCPTLACRPDEACEGSGHCRLTTCDEEGALACPEHWACDPEAALLEPKEPVAGALGDAFDYLHQMDRGCTRLKCDEPGGLECNSNWVCDPATADDPSGCVPLSCEESGQCSDDERFICEPTSSARRPVFTDVHGCVSRNCEEGALCGTDMVCDPASPEAGDAGCRQLTCEEGFVCPAAYVCDPSHPDATRSGCRHDPSGTGGTGSGGSAGASGGTGGGTAGTAPNGGSSSGTTGRAGSGTGGTGSGTGGTGAGASSNTGAGGSHEAGDAGMGRCVAR